MRMTTFGTSLAALLLILAIVVVALLGAEVNRPNASAGVDSPANAYKLSKPFTHNNLTIYLIHGADTIKNRNILTLQEAMAAKKVRVIETKDVNELAIENLSQTDDVFVQSGDIVKGGQQDRVLAVDLILPPRSGRIPIAAFCVESGRWSKRGNEDAAQFNASDDRIATRDLKVAANSTRSQGDVWKKVGEAQERLSQNVGGAVNSSVSVSSLQLSLENKQVREATEAYIKAFLKIVDGQSDVIGYAFAINGKMNSADVYASNALFKKLWPKLLRATA
ncbi:MAG: ARPP-1 family domain-containing protein, partial [Pyrinomonadaceae bacterium]